MVNCFVLRYTLPLTRGFILGQCCCNVHAQGCKEQYLPGFLERAMTMIYGGSSKRPPFPSCQPPCSCKSRSHHPFSEPSSMSLGTFHPMSTVLLSIVKFLLDLGECSCWHYGIIATSANKLTLCDHLKTVLVFHPICKHKGFA